MADAAMGQTLAVKRIKARFTASDAIVVAAVVVAVLLGWGLKAWHDDQVHESEVSGVTVAYPEGWIRLPATEPVLLRAVSDDDGQSQVVLTGTATTQTDVLLAVAAGGDNPAASETAYTQLGNEAADVDGEPAIRTDYAYVKTRVGGSTAPVVVEGRQFAWIKDGMLYAIAFEAPQDQWDDLEGDVKRMIDKVKS